MTNFEFMLCLIATMALFFGFALTLLVIAIGSKTSKHGALRLFDLVLRHLRNLLR